MKAKLACWMALTVGSTVTGCSGEGRDEGGQETGIATAVNNTATESDSGDSATESDGSDSDSGIKLDVGGANETEGADCVDGVGPGCDTGCVAVDLLFVVDNSVSMTSEQVALGEAFPGFADTIIAALPENVSLHIGVTSTTFEPENFAVGDGTCTGSLGGSTVDMDNPTSYCSSDADCGAFGVCRAPLFDFGEDIFQPGVCGYQPENYYEPPTTSANVANGTHGSLYVTDGIPYYEIDTSASQAEIDDLKAWFTNAATIGNEGSQIEFPLAGAAWAMDTVANPGNAGFVRDEGAVLVVFFLTDEPDQTPESAKDEMLGKFLDAKQECGGWECIIGGGFVVNGCSAETPIGDFFSGLPNAPMTAEFPEDPTNTAYVDPAIFAPVLSDALASVIVETCNNIPPPG